MSHKLCKARKGHPDEGGLFNTLGERLAATRSAILLSIGIKDYTTSSIAQMPQGQMPAQMPQPMQR